MNAQKVSIYDIARELGVSASTVSRALNDNPVISETVRKMVKDKAEELNFVPNHIAVALKTGKTRTIGMVVPLIDRNYFIRAIAAVEKEVYAAGYDLLIASTGNFYEREKMLVESLGQGRVIGVICAVAAETRDYSHYEALISKGIPIVMIDRKMPIRGCSMVMQDDFEGAYAATRHLIAQGCRKIYHYRGPQNVSLWKERDEGYRKAMEEAGIKIGKNWVYTALTTSEEGRKYADRIIKGALPIPDGILFSGDFAAKSALEAFAEAGIKVPQDIAIVGFVNEPWDQYLNPPLSSIEQFPDKIGETAAKLIIDAINGQPAQNVVYTPELIVRESSLKSKYRYK